jgi:hypothetical protein
LILGAATLPEIIEFKKFAENYAKNTEQNIRGTIKLSMINSNIDEFYRKSHINKFEQLFNQKIGFKDWKFRDRVYIEQLEESWFKQNLLRSLREEPEVVSSVDPETGVMYMGIAFKTPPGRMIYYNWQSEKNLIPDFQSWRSTEAKSLRRKYFNISEDQVGTVGEKRTLIMPADGSKIDVRSYTMKFQKKAKVTVQKRDVTFGIKEVARREESQIRSHLLQHFKQSVITHLIKDQSGAELEKTLEEIEENEDESIEDSFKLDKPQSDKLLGDISRVILHQGKCCELYFQFKFNLRITFTSTFSELEQYSYSDR